MARTSRLRLWLGGVGFVVLIAAAAAFGAFQSLDDFSLAVDRTRALSAPVPIAPAEAFQRCQAGGRSGDTGSAEPIADAIGKLVANGEEMQALVKKSESEAGWGGGPVNVAPRATQTASECIGVGQPEQR